MFLAIKHSNFKLVFCGLLATALLPACGGGSSSSSGGADSRTYQQGYAAGTVATVDHVLAQLNTLHASLTGSTPAQTGSGTLGRSIASLEPRQRADLAAELLKFIERVTMAREEAAGPGAGVAAAEAAQTAAEQALQALQLVVAADTAERAGGGEAAQDAAIRALRQVVAVDPTADNARETITSALNEALMKAQVEVTRLAAALATARAGGNADLAELQTALTAAEAARDSAAAARDAAHRALGRGDTNPSRFDPGMVSVQYFPRTNASGAALDTSDLLQIPTDGVAYAAGKTVLTERTDATDEYPVRGTVYRGALRGTTSTSSAVVALYGSNRASKYRLVRQGAADTRAFRVSDDSWNNFYQRARTSIRFDSSGNPIVSYGSEPGDGHIFSDLEREQATQCSSITDLCNDATTNDIRITFGARTDGGDPAGEPVRYWRKTVPWPRVDQDPTEDGLQDHPYWNEIKTTPCDPEASGCVSETIASNTRAPHLGPPSRDSVYEFLLSSYAPDLKGMPSTSDDTGRYLSYAAYGLWKFSDGFWRHVYVAGAPFGYSSATRFHTFHFGLDAFGTHNPLPTGAEGSFKGTFGGSTMGWIVHSNPNEGRTKRNLDGTTRLRGTIELTAHIGAIESKTNKVSGAIRNLEYWDGVNWDKGGETTSALGGWHPRRSFNELEITLAEGAIDAQGAFTGATSTTSTTTGGGVHNEHSKYWGPGEYEGAFYGPTTNLEAAGTWFLPAADGGTATGPGSAAHFNSIAGLVGSFGAACDSDCPDGN